MKPRVRTYAGVASSTRTRICTASIASSVPPSRSGAMKSGLNGTSMRLVPTTLSQRGGARRCAVGVSSQPLALRASSQVQKTARNR